MKKLLLFKVRSTNVVLSAVISLTASVSSAQTCTPQYQDSTFGAWPDTTTNFAHAYVNTPYVQLLDFKAPADAGDVDPDFAGNAIQSYKVTSVNGLPTGFTYNCSAANCTYTGGNAGCAELVGTATSGQEGTYNLEINIEATIMPSFPPIPIPYPHTFVGYKLVIEPELSTTLVAPNDVYIFPNPATSTVNIVNADKFESLLIFGVNGQLITQKEISSSEETIDVSELKEGIYFIHLVNSTTTSVHKFTKK